jgi:8-oxo-dGTP diphosphatase
MNRIVVGAAIIEDGRLLAARRADPPELAGLWEFPGGKVEPGETEDEALIRECAEELGVEVVVGERIGGDWPLANGYVMRVLLATVVAGVPEAKEHLAVRWLALDELFDVSWVPADLPIVWKVRERLTGI